MAASKSLILLKGIGGLAATSLATLGGMEVGYKLLSSKTVERTESDEDSRDIEVDPEEYNKEISDLGIPGGCVESCELTAEQLRGLKFEGRSDSSVIFDGLDEGDTFELTIEKSGDSANYPRGKKYILKAKATTGTVTIKNVKGDDIVLEGNQGVDLRETNEGGWLEKVPEEVNDLGIPKRCEVEQDGDQTTKTCELTREQLQRLKFEPKDSGGSISVSGLKENERVELTIEKVSGDNYPKGKKYTLKSKSRTVTIKGVKEGDIVLEENKGVEFREKQDDNKLETVEDSLSIPRRCDDTCQLTKEELQRLKFETGDESSIEVDGLDDSEKVELTVETTSDPINYPKGKKYTLKVTTGTVTIKGVKGGDIVLEAEQEVVIRETSEGGRLEKVPEEVNELGIPKRCKVDEATGDTKQTCELTKEQLQRFKFEAKGNEAIAVEGLTEGNIVTLEIEEKKDDLNYPKGKKYTLKTTNDNVTIRNVKEGDITITKEQDVVIRETGRGGKLEEVPEEIDELGVPKRCGTEQPCKLTKDQLQRLRFETKSSSSISIAGLGENDTVDLKVEESEDTTNYPKNKKYTLTSTNSKVTIKGVKEGDIDLESNQGVVVREKSDGGLLEKWAEEVDDLGVPKSCATETCQLTKEQLRKIKFEPKDETTSVFISGLGNNDKVELTVTEVSGDKANYPKNKKYSFKSKKEGVTINGTKDGDIVLEENKTFDFREKEGGELETVEDALGIPKGCKAGEVKKRPDIRTCELTADQLKSLKIQNFKGKADSVTNLTDKITLKILWEEESRYPGNIRYSLDNTSNEREVKITKGGRNTKIEKNKESWFKNLNGELVLVEAKTKSEVKMKEVNEILKKLGLLFEKLELKLSESDFKDSNNPTKYQQKTFDFKKVDDLKKIKFKDLGGNADSTNPNSLNNSQKITVYFDWEEDENKYPKNMKFTFEIDGFDQGFEFKKGGQSVKICKKGKDVQNIFKVEDDQLVNVPN